VRFDRLGRDGEVPGDLFVRVTPGDQPEHLALAGRDLVQLGVETGGDRVGGGGVGEGIEDKAGQARREHGIAGSDAVHRLQQFAAGNGLGDIAAGSGTDNGDDVLRRVGYGQGEEPHVGMVREDPVEHGVTAAAGEMDVEQDHIGDALVDELDGGVDLVRLADDLHGVAELGPHTGPEDGVVLDEENPRAASLRHLVGDADVGGDGAAVGDGDAAGIGIFNSTSVPSPGADRITTVPP
jgi:hypothetical protein